jgi:hypothetical protein
MKKTLSLLMAVLMVFAMVGCTKTETPASQAPASEEPTPAPLKIGVILVGDPSDMGYNYNHVVGMQEMQQALGVTDDQIVYKNNVPEGAECETAVRELVEAAATSSSPTASDTRTTWSKWPPSIPTSSSATPPAISVRRTIWPIPTTTLPPSMRPLPRRHRRRAQGQGNRQHQARLCRRQALRRGHFRLHRVLSRRQERLPRCDHGRHLHGRMERRDP